MCISDDDTVFEIDAPSYSLTIYDNFTTLNDEDLDVPCSYDYQLAWQQKVIGMVATLNSEMSTGNICSGDKLIVITASTSFSPMGNKVCPFTFSYSSTHLQGRYQGL